MTMQFHDDDLLRVDQFVAKPRGADDGAKPIIPVSRTAWLSGVKRGIFPQPVRLGVRGVFWRYADLRRVREQGTAN
jgi:hypothetical protein